jgi:hypothetical protein
MRWGLVIGVGALGKCLGVGGRELNGGALDLSSADRIGALEQQLAAAAGLLTCFRQPDGMCRAEAMVSSALRPIPEDPPPPPAIRDAQIQPAAVVMPALPGASDL